MNETIRKSIRETLMDEELIKNQALLLSGNHTRNMVYGFGLELQQQVIKRVNVCKYFFFKLIYVKY